MSVSQSRTWIQSLSNSKIVSKIDRYRFARQETCSKIKINVTAWIRQGFSNWQSQNQNPNLFSKERRFSLLSGEAITGVLTGLLITGDLRGLRKKEFTVFKNTNVSKCICYQNLQIELLHAIKSVHDQLKQEEQMLKWPIFTVLTGLFHSQLSYKINYHDHKHLSCLMQLYNRMTTQVLAFH